MGVPVPVLFGLEAARCRRLRSLSMSVNVRFRSRLALAAVWCGVLWSVASPAGARAAFLDEVLLSLAWPLPRGRIGGLLGGSGGETDSGTPKSGVRWNQSRSACRGKPIRERRHAGQRSGRKRCDPRVLQSSDSFSGKPVLESSEQRRREGRLIRHGGSSGRSQGRFASGIRRGICFGGWAGCRPGEHFFSFRHRCGSPPVHRGTLRDEER